MYKIVKNSGKSETVHRYSPVSEIYHTTGQTGTASSTVLTSLVVTEHKLFKKTNLNQSYNKSCEEEWEANGNNFEMKRNYIFALLVVHFPRFLAKRIDGNIRLPPHFSLFQSQHRKRQRRPPCSSCKSQKPLSLS